MSTPAEFVKLTTELVAMFETVLDDPEWSMKRYVKKMRDVDRQIFEIPFLTIQKGPTRVSLDPTGYDVPDAEAAIDLYLMPTYDQVAWFSSERGRWYVHSEFLDKDKDDRTLTEGRRALLSPDTLKQVMERIAADAVPSL